jgi:hypothetical protein
MFPKFLENLCTPELGPAFYGIQQRAEGGVRLQNKWASRPPEWWMLWTQTELSSTNKNGTN